MTLYQGSTTTRDWITDADWQPIAPLQQSILWDSQVHRGFYFGLFGEFLSIPEATTEYWTDLNLSLAREYHVPP